MPRYIDADRLLKNTIYNPNHVPYIAESDIIFAPAADVVDVVRCHKCCHWNGETVRQNSNDFGWWNEAICEEHSRYGNEPYEVWTTADGFCDCGERREDGL